MLLVVQMRYGIAYIRTSNGFVYLTSIMDLFSRKMIAWTLSRTLDVSVWLISSIKSDITPICCWWSTVAEKVSMYPRYMEKLLQKCSIAAGKGLFYEIMHACIKSLHALIKRQCLNQFKICDYQQTYRLVCEYMAVFYNIKHLRFHITKWL